MQYKMFSIVIIIIIYYLLEKHIRLEDIYNPYFLSFVESKHNDVFISPYISYKQMLLLFLFLKFREFNYGLATSPLTLPFAPIFIVTRLVRFLGEFFVVLLLGCEESVEAATEPKPILANSL